MCVRVARTECCGGGATYRDFAFQCQCHVSDSVDTRSTLSQGNWLWLPPRENIHHHLFMSAETIDEDLQSRQMAVYGRESMQKLRHAKVLISGLNGLGAEIAKNVILANVKSVTLHDDKMTTTADCGANFYLSEAAVGMNRAAACSKQMQELNPGVFVSAMDGQFPLSGALSRFTVVVAVDVSSEVAFKADQYCRAQTPPIAFIRADVRGLSGFAFVDLGPKFTCLDPTGESIKSAIVESISPVAESSAARVARLASSSAASGQVLLRVQCVEDDALDLDDGDHITFSEIEGLPNLNGTAPLPVTDVSKGRKCFVVSVPAAAASGTYVRGGLITERRMPKQIEHRSYQAFVTEDPGALWEVDESKMSPAATSFAEDFLAVFGSPKANVSFGRSGLLHLGFRALDAYAMRHGGKLPAPVDASAAEEVYQLARAINDSSPIRVAELDLPARATVLRQMAMGARAVLCPMSAILGGIVGQEVVKAATGKFHPLTQGFYFDAFEALPDKALPLEAEFANAAAEGRYEPQVAVFGRSFQARLSNLRVFLVGSGALGCELIKNLALMGVSTGPEAKLTVTDDDVIEKSNLSRQFLFRNHDVGKAKSLSAVRAAGAMNPSLRAVALQDRVAPETEEVFNSSFWLSLDVVIVRQRRWIEAARTLPCASHGNCARRPMSAPSLAACTHACSLTVASARSLCVFSLCLASLTMTECPRQCEGSPLRRLSVRPLWEAAARVGDARHKEQHPVHHPAPDGELRCQPRRAGEGGATVRRPQFPSQH